MKTIILALLTSLPLWAITPENSIKQLEGINQTPTEVNCAEVAHELYKPVDALKDINTGKLTFLGRSLFPGNDQNYTCVYKSETAYVLYNNCLSSKKESSATDIEVISFNGDIASFYIQNKTADVAVSATPRSDYNMTWRVSVTVSPAVSSNLTVADLKRFKETYTPVSPGCSIGTTFKAQAMDSKAFCIGRVKNPAWQEAGEAFWKEPTAEWYETQKYLRKVVVGTKF